MQAGKFKKYSPNKRKKVIFLIATMVVLAAAAGMAAAAILPKLKERIDFRSLLRVKLSSPNASAVTTCPLCGGPVGTGLAHTPPLVVKIDNEERARPQSGLPKADVVYEVPVEGGISRYSAVYLCKQSEKIGPVRSARFSDVDITKGLKGVLVHCGGTEVTLNRLAASSVPDLDEMRNSRAFWRSESRRAPHNLYTKPSLMRAAAKKRGLLIRTDPPRFVFKSAWSASKKPLKSIAIRFSNSYRISYRYDPQTNRFIRYVEGSLCTDKETGRAIASKNVIVQYAVIEETDFVEDVAGSKSLQPHLLGSGKAILFRDGLEIPCKWYKTSEGEPTRYLDNSGKAILLNQGQSWIEIVPVERSVQVTK